ncbi:hypothetical protein [Streptomyces sp. NBC_00576]|uniref:hypothetical protein n=1 Tax=Streptomyces sp. NBC_00576 TaxID=2903665 RepID=UPI002E7FE0DA|nr:hypothetical protein [Streptomyces sp. NBC_00576]WUB69374.1 hypothetical protein OG734_04375 [Streptomyces sp. NBC_00576]
MPRKTISRSLLIGAVLSASLALGAVPSYADMSPQAAGISDSDWSLVGQVGSYNNAYMEYVDNQGEATLVFTGGNVPDQLQWPSGFPGFSNANLALYGEYSQFASNSDIDTTISDTAARIQAAGYGASSGYDPDTDVVDVTTDAPSSVTNPLVSTYGNKIHIVVGTPAISDSDWARIQEIADYNGAYTVYLDAQNQPTLVFTGGQVPAQLQYPSDFHGFTDRNLALYGEYSQFASNSAIDATIDDVTTRISNAGYGVSSAYDAYTDVVDVTTDAPSSVTNPLVSTYGNKIHIIAGSLATQSDGTGNAGKTSGSPKKHSFKNHAPGKKSTATKHAPARKPAPKKHVSAKHFKKASAAPGAVHKTRFTVPK